jgi:hypothetical protein
LTKECLYISDDKKSEWDLLVLMLTAGKNWSSQVMALKWVANPVILFANPAKACHHDSLT